MKALATSLSKVAMCVYLDHNSTTPMEQEVLYAVKSVAEGAWFNPSSAYDRKAKDVIKQSRQSVAKMLNANPNDFLFTSGGTESNFLVFNTFSRNSSGVLPLVITSNIEHPSVLLPLNRLATLDLIGGSNRLSNLGYWLLWFVMLNANP
ncbi:hypothetical protein AHF37_08947 [Paragonimus kellicotti]|nr:hypothetical protein AHF37_08947 [Paragonimus kellicotti]